MRKKKGTNIIKRILPGVLGSTVREEIQFPQLTDASPDPVLITDTRREIYYVNPAWEKLTGYTFEEVRGRNPRLLQSGKTPRAVYTTIWKKLLKGQSFSTDEIINRKKNGQEFQVHATYFPVKKKNKNIFYVQMFHDITHRKTLDRQRDAFIGIASHELKTPVTTLFAYAQMLEKSLMEKKDEKDRTFVRNIKIQSERLVDLINDLLNVSRIDSGRLEFRYTSVDLNDLAQEVITNFQYTSENHKIFLEGEISRNIWADPQRIEEVIINLLTNAIKYSPKKDKIVVHLSCDNEYALVKIIDFGFGISKKDLPHIFERFYRTKDKTDGKISGFGLGLYICSQIIKKHKGRLYAESKKGYGSSFIFSLPLIKKRK